MANLTIGDFKKAFIDIPFIQAIAKSPKIKQIASLASSVLAIGVIGLAFWYIFKNRKIVKKEPAPISDLLSCKLSAKSTFLLRANDPLEVIAITQMIKNKLKIGFISHEIDSFLRHALRKSSIQGPSLWKEGVELFALSRYPIELLKDELRETDQGPLWGVVKEAIRKGGQKASAINAEQTPTWVTGSRSSSLIGIDEVAKIQVTNGQHALVPTGVLLQHSIVPLTGELGSGMRENIGVNINSLSGVFISYLHEAAGYANAGFKFDLEKSKSYIRSFDNYFSEDYLYKPYNDLKIHVIRYLKMRDLVDSDFPLIKGSLNVLYDRQKSETTSAWRGMAAAGLLGQEIPPNSRDYLASDSLLIGSPVGVPRSDGRVTWGIISRIATDGTCSCVLDADTTKEILLTKLKIPTSLSFPHEDTSSALIDKIEGKFQLGSSKLALIIALFDTVKPLSLEDDQKETLKDNFPILWGGNLCEDDLTHVSSSIKGERGFKGNAVLGKEITTVFVKKKDVISMKAWLEKRKLRVQPLTISAAYYLQLKKWFQVEQGK